VCADLRLPTLTSKSPVNMDPTERTSTDGDALGRIVTHTRDNSATTTLPLFRGHASEEGLQAAYEYTDRGGIDPGEPAGQGGRRLAEHRPKPAEPEPKLRREIRRSKSEIRNKGLPLRLSGFVSIRVHSWETPLPRILPASLSPEPSAVRRSTADPFGPRITRMDTNGASGGVRAAWKCRRRFRSAERARPSRGREARTLPVRALPEPLAPPCVRGSGGATLHSCSWKSAPLEQNQRACAARTNPAKAPVSWSVVRGPWSVVCGLSSLVTKLQASSP
jgi:hypothetical protein